MEKRCLRAIPGRGFGGTMHLLAKLIAVIIAMHPCLTDLPMKICLYCAVAMRWRQYLQAHTGASAEHRLAIGVERNPLRILDM